jgi:hypothetical protein
MPEEEDDDLFADLDEEISFEQLSKLAERAGFPGMKLEDFADLGLDEAMEEDLKTLNAMLGNSGMQSGENVEIRQSSVQFVTGSDVQMHQSAALNVAAETATLQASAAGMVRAESVSAQNSASLAVVGSEVTYQGGLAAVVLGRSVQGNVRVLFDWRGALAFGAGLTLGLGIIGMIRRTARLFTGR